MTIKAAVTGWGRRMRPSLRSITMQVERPVGVKRGMAPGARMLLSPGTIAPVEPATKEISSGRDPAWREAWEGRLDESSREAVEVAVRNRTPVGDPRLRPYVLGLIARRRRALHLRTGVWVFVTLVVAVWVYATTILRPSLFALFWIAALVVCLTVVSFRIRMLRRALVEGERVNGLSGSPRV
jgi:hypothetical protein